MEIDDENDCSHNNRSNNLNTGINSFEPFIHPSPHSTQSLNRRLAPNSIGLQMTPTKMLLNQARRSSSGIFITSMFGSRFRHLQKLHSDAFLGLNAVCLPGLPVGAVFRSSLPATPVATPLHREAFQQFSEQAIRERLCRTPSPRKNRGFLSLALQQQQQQQQQQREREEQSTHHQMESEGGNYSDSGTHDTGLNDVQPMDITSPIIDEPVIEDAKEEDNANGSGFGEQYFGHNDRLNRKPSDPYNERRLFVGNISYRVSQTQLMNFFEKFGKVYNCVIVKDHIKRLPKGYGFVTFRNATDAHSVLNADSSQLTLDNRQLRVFYAKPKSFKQMKQKVQELNKERDQIIKLRDDSALNDTSNFVKISPNVYSFDDLDDDVILHVFEYVDSMIDKTVLELETLFSILKKCPNLRSIDLKHVTKFLDTKALEIIAISCPLLEEIIFDCGPVTDYGLKIFSENCQNLKLVHLNDCTNFSEKGLWWLLKNTKKLTDLEIRNNSRVTAKCFRLLSETIQSLDITSCDKIWEKGFRELIGGNRSALQKLSLSSVSYNMMQMICLKLTNLKVLRIPFATALIDSNDPITGFTLISKLKNLEVLECLAKFEDLNNESILSIISNCNKLKELILMSTSYVTDISIARIPEYCPNLERLCVSESKISDKSLTELSIMKHLSYLDISGCIDISDIGVQVLVSNCKALHFLDLNRCEQITYDCLKFAVQTVKSNILFSELVISYNSMRIHTKNISVNDIEKVLVERERYLQDMYYDSAENYGFQDYFYNDDYLSTDSDYSTNRNYGSNIDPLRMS